MRGAKQRPVARVKVSKERAFRDDEEKPGKGGNDVARSIEEEELAIVGYHICLGIIGFSIPWRRRMS